MQYAAVSILILIRLICQITGQASPPLPQVPPTSTTGPSPNPSPSSTGPSPSAASTLASSNPSTASCPDDSNPSSSGPTPPPSSSTTPTSSTSSGSNPSSTTPGGSGMSPPSSTGGSGTSPGGSGSDNLSCIKNLLSLCESYQFQFNKVSEEYGCTRFLNTYIFIFHTNLVESSMECDTLMQLEVMRQNIMTTKGQPGPSTHAF